MLRSLRNEAILSVREVDFVFVYVKEAHAHGEWPISSGRFNHGNGPVRVKQPTTNAHRLTLAHRFQNEHDPNRDAFDVALADDFERGDQFELEFAPWLFRFFGVGSGNGDCGETKTKRLEFVSHPKNATYDLVAVRNWILGLEDFASQAGE